ncbi:hypothetical protein DENSPDRAFT_840256 [Dentipellis sp. KUC8613]|nr:hypothetical protein DENSPDRAFT_840256 [Dentipellis sp. KUC8613]
MSIFPPSVISSPVARRKQLKRSLETSEQAPLLRTDFKGGHGGLRCEGKKLSTTITLLMSSSEHEQESSIFVLVPVPAQSGDRSPQSKFDTARLAIRKECSEALERKIRKEITHEDFMQIANDCVERDRLQREAADKLDERARRGEISRAEFRKESGISDDDWEKITPEIRRHFEVMGAYHRRNRAQGLRSQRLGGR